MNAFLAIILVLVSLASTAKAFGIENKGSILSDMADMQISIEGESKEEEKPQKQKLKDPKEEEDASSSQPSPTSSSPNCRADRRADQALNTVCNWAETIIEFRGILDDFPVRTSGFVDQILTVCGRPRCGLAYLGWACHQVETMKDELYTVYNHLRHEDCAPECFVPNTQIIPENDWYGSYPLYPMVEHIAYTCRQAGVGSV